MSSYFSFFDCGACGHREFVGLVGERNDCPVYCTVCHDRCLLAPPAGEQYLQTALPHEILILGHKEETIYSKKGRMKKTKRVRAWVDSGLRVSILEDLRQIGEKIYLTYTPIWETALCPACQRMGTLLDFRTYLQKCPKCGSQRMSEGDL